MIERWTSAIAILFFLASAADAARPGETILDRLFVIDKEKPLRAEASFAACDPGGRFHLVVHNGARAHPRVRKGEIEVNGKRVVDGNELAAEVEKLRKKLRHVAPENRVAVRLNGERGAAIRVRVEAEENCAPQASALRIEEPAAGAVLDSPTVIVAGSIGADADGAAVAVDGRQAFVVDDRFAVVLPITPATTEIRADAIREGAVVASASVAVTVAEPPPGKAPVLSPFPPSGTAPLQVRFFLSGVESVSAVSLDLDGAEPAEMTGGSLDGRAFTLTEPGLYRPRATIEHGDGSSTPVETLVRVHDETSFDSELRAKWTAMRDALRAGNVELALEPVMLRKREKYRRMFEALGGQGTNVDAIFGELRMVRLEPGRVEYEAIRTENGQRVSALVLFAFDDDGVWRLRFF